MKKLDFQKEIPEYSVFLPTKAFEPLQCLDFQRRFNWTGKPVFSLPLFLLVKRYFELKDFGID